MKKTILILGGSSSIAKELDMLHYNDDVYYSYHTTMDNSNNAFYLDLYNINSYENIPLIAFDLIYSFLGFTPDVNLIEDLETSKTTIERNFLYPTLVIQYIINGDRVKTHTKIKIITSVAGIRGRKLNFVYGASKSGLQTLIEGLANKYPQLKFSDIILGPVYTDAVPNHNSPRVLISNPQQVAKIISRSNKQRVFIPGYWQYIMLIIRIIPNNLYNRLNL